VVMIRLFLCAIFLSLTVGLFQAEAQIQPTAMYDVLTFSEVDGLPEPERSEIRRAWEALNHRYDFDLTRYQFRVSYIRVDPHPPTITFVRTSIVLPDGSNMLDLEFQTFPVVVDAEGVHLIVDESATETLR
jgi:hypothetical protein